MSRPARWLYLVMSAAPPVLRIQEFVTAVQGEGWNVALIATPTAAGWIDLETLAAVTGSPLRVHARPPHLRDSLPRADIVIAAPITFNSINKWAAGFSDTVALGILNEMLGTGVPLLAVPCAKPVLRRHPAYSDSVARLTAAGVSIMDPDVVTIRGEDGLATFDWPKILDRFRKLAAALD